MPPPSDSDESLPPGPVVKGDLLLRPAVSEAGFRICPCLRSKLKSMTYT